MQKLTFLFLFCFSFAAIQSQVLVKFRTPEELVQDILIGTDAGVAVTNVVYTGSMKSIAAFYSATKSLPIQEGLVLSSGLAEQIDGPNQDPNKGTARFTPGDADLDFITRKLTSDASILEFDFIPNTDKIEFDYFFASEEYPEFVNKGVNDVFAFFISGPGFNGKQNIAYLPSTGDPVTVDHVNANKNSEYFKENYPWIAANVEMFRQNADKGELSFSFQFDGMTTLLKATAKVIPYQKYRLKIAIADVGDNIYDSAVLLKYHSFKSTGKREALSKIMEKDFNRLFIDSDLYKLNIKDTGVIISSNIHFDFNSHIVKEEYFDDIDIMVDLLTRYFDINLTLVGHTDDLGTEQYNLELSYERARAIANYLISKGIGAERIKVIGKGKTEAIVFENNQQMRALNRRVEFVFNEIAP